MGAERLPCVWDCDSSESRALLNGEARLGEVDQLWAALRLLAHHTPDAFVPDDWH